MSNLSASKGTRETLYPQDFRDDTIAKKIIKDVKDCDFQTEICPYLAQAIAYLKRLSTIGSLYLFTEQKVSSLVLDEKVATTLVQHKRIKKTKDKTRIQNANRKLNE